MFKDYSALINLFWLLFVLFTFTLFTSVLYILWGRENICPHFSRIVCLYWTHVNFYRKRLPNIMYIKKIIEVYNIWKKKLYIYIVSTSQKKEKERKKVHEVSTSLVLLSFLLGSPIFKFFLFIYFICLFIYLFIYLCIVLYFSQGFLSNTCLDICKANNNEKLYIYTLL